MPACSAASMMRVPLGTVTSMPLIRQVTVSVCSFAIVSHRERAGRYFAPAARYVFVAELRDRARDRRRARIAQHRDRPARHAAADLEQRVEIFHRPLTGLDA